MNATVIRIGNSHGIILPSKMMAKMSLLPKDNVEIIEKDGGLLLRKIDPAAVNSPFHAIDVWNEEHGYADDTEEEVEAYIESIRSSRRSKEIPKW